MLVAAGFWREVVNDLMWQHAPEPGLGGLMVSAWMLGVCVGGGGIQFVWGEGRVLLVLIALWCGVV